MKKVSRYKESFRGTADYQLQKEDKDLSNRTMYEKISNLYQENRIG